MKSVYEGTHFKMADPNQLILSTTAAKSTMGGFTNGFAAGVSPQLKKKKKKARAA